MTARYWVAMASAMAIGIATAGENLLRDDFMPDNIGGVLGWSVGGDSNVKVDVSPLAPDAPGGLGGVRITGHRLGVCPSDYKFQSALRLPLIPGERYRMSVQVRTHGVFYHRVVFRAKTSEAEVVFSDWKESGVPAVAVGQQTMLNYIGVYPYFYEGEWQLEQLKRFTQQAKSLKQ
ncbi:MAG: hypothetical protein IKO72_01545 [Kiritimatiellae bacterium]|nr:hypothetical protein [Kiritimatiellia bacterium]